jgi:hypothetical protein
MPKAALLTLVVVLGCSAVPDPPPYPQVGIEPIERMRLSGAVVDYEVRAPVDRVREVFLDFEGRAKNRPRILGIRLVSGDEKSGLISVRFLEPSLGFEGSGTCRYETSWNGREFRIRYEMVESSISLWQLEAETFLRPRADGRHTHVHQTLVATTMSMDRSRLPDFLRADAESVREIAERR